MKKSMLFFLILVLAAATAFTGGSNQSASSSNVTSMPGPMGKYSQPITLHSARTIDITALVDPNDPAIRSFTDNRWTHTMMEYLNIDLKYSWVAVDNDSNTARWAAAIASRQLPDFALVTNQVYKMLLDSDLVADCTAVYRNYASDDYKALGDDSILSQLIFNNVQRGLPLFSPAYMNGPFLFVRQDWLNTLGLKYPVTMNEIINTARAFQQAKLGGDNTMGLMFSANSGDGRLDGFMNMYGAYRDYWIEINGKMAWSNIQPQMRTALLALQDLYKQNLINQDFAVTTADLANEYVASGKTGIFWGISYAPVTSMTALYDNDPKAEIIPSMVRGLNGEEIKIQIGGVSVGKVFVNKDCRYPEAVMKMLNLADYLCRTDSYN